MLELRFARIALTLCAAALALPAAAQDKLRIGFITTLTGPSGVIGKHQQDSVELALDHVGRKVGGLDTELIVADDQQKPDIGRQIAEEMVKRHKVTFVSGVIWSNVMLSVYTPVVKAQTFLIGANAGPSDLAGAQCSPYFFSASLQNDQPPEALGKHMQDKGIDNVFIIVPNYAAGRDDVAGFKRFYKRNVVGEIYFQLGQQDFAAEIAQIRAAIPSAVFVFAPGGMGIQFVKQYAQSGLKEKAPIYSVYTSDDVTLPAQREAALGNYEARHWNADLDNPANRKFVGDFRKKYGYTPSWYGAQAYDAIMLMDSAVRAVKGKLSDKKGLRAAIEKADFKSVRGDFKFNTNHFPIQTYYLLQVVEDGGQYVTKVRDTIFREHKDAYHGQCKMD